MCIECVWGHKNDSVSWAMAENCGKFFWFFVSEKTGKTHNL